MNAMTDAAQKMQKTTTEEIHVAGNELMTRVKGLIAEGRVRHIKVKSPNGETYFEVPLAVGVLGGAALAWASPFLAMAGALAGMVTSLKVEVVRDADAVDAIEDGAKAAADKAWEAATAAKKTATKALRGAVSTAKRAAGKAPARAVAAAKKAPAKAAKAAKPLAKKVAKTAPKAAAKKKGR